MPAPDEGAPAPQPDWLLIQNGRMPDWGPVYTETPPNPFSPDAPSVAEPWNTVTATFFVFIALWFVWRVRGRYQDFPFLTACMPILLTGAIGGVLFHGTRTRVTYFLLDVVPISLLGLAGSLFMAYRLWGRGSWKYFLPGICVFYVTVNRVLFRAIGPVDMQWSVNLSYASLALVVLFPIVLVLWRTRFRHGGWVVAGVVSFAIAWFFRLVDREIGTTLPMGSHWLWHTFGAISTTLVIQFFYKVEGDSAASREMQNTPRMNTENTDQKTEKSRTGDETPF